ncbi:MAG: DNA cytosine methyltransferase [Candidatus Dormibacteria bacterium]
MRWTHSPDPAHARTFVEDGCRWGPVRSCTAGHPETLVYNLSVADDESYVADGIVVHNCTTHSLSGGRRHDPNLFNPDGDPSVERSRATMWDVPRFAEFHQYRMVIVENVVEVRSWPPYQAWLEAMRLLGYEHREVFLNSMVAHPTPQSRDRIYIVFWRSGAKAPNLDFRAEAWCPACEKPVEAYQAWKRPDRRGGKYRSQYLYRCPACFGVTFPYAFPAAAAIDWTLPAQRIGDRLKPLAPATLRRVRIGLERFGVALVQGAGNTYERPGSEYARAWSVLDPSPAMTATLSHGVACPPIADGLVVPVHHGNEGPEARLTAIPWPTQTGRQEQALVIPMRTNGRPQRVETGPTATVTTAHGGGQTLVTLPFIAELRGGSSDARSVAEPAATVVASGNHHALVVPYRGKGLAQTTDQPLPTQDTRDRFALVLKNYSARGDERQALAPAAEPLGAVTTQDHHSVVEIPEPPQVDVDDCGFRMLEPHEIQAAMAFPNTFVVLGSKRDRVRMLGNAVTPPVTRMLMERCLESLA